MLALWILPITIYLVQFRKKTACILAADGAKADIFIGFQSILMLDFLLFLLISIIDAKCGKYVALWL